MKRNFSKKTICLAVAACVLSASVFVGSAMAYFTAFDTASGGVKLDFGFTETIPNEKVEDGKKQITLTNTGAYDCYVRLKALTGDAYKDGLAYSEPDGAGKWTPGTDGYYYYSDIVAPGQTTTQLDVSFLFPAEIPADFNVIIIQECTPVLCDNDGNPYADWNVKADVSQTIFKEDEDQEGDKADASQSVYDAKEDEV